MKMKHLTITAAALVAPVFLAAPAIAQPVVPSAPYQTVDLPLITISANAEVDAEPDMATVGTGVQTRAATAREAVGQANVKTRELIDAIVKTGVARKDVQKNILWVVQGHDHPWLLAPSLRAEDVSWVAGEAPVATQIAAKTRYRQADAPCSLATDATGFTLRFAEPQWAVTPGQSAVLYDGEVCLGGGVIHTEAANAP